MVCPRLLVGLLLFSLFPLFSTGVEEGAEVEEINLNYLSQIIQFIHTKYSPGESYYNETLQFAVAINVPAHQCRSPIDQNFLSGENATVVKKHLNESNLYQGEHLIAATPMKGRSKSKIHSERALLMCEDISQAVTPMKNLLNKDKRGCVVFYTYNSPCLSFCLNQEKDDYNRNQAVEKCILKSLSMLTDPKAFVFKRVYRKDLKDPNDRNYLTYRNKLANGLKKVAEKVPLYKCASGFCVRCLSDNQIINECLTENIAVQPIY